MDLHDTPIYRYFKDSTLANPLGTLFAIWLPILIVFQQVLNFFAGELAFNDWRGFVGGLLCLIPTYYFLLRVRKLHYTTHAIRLVKLSDMVKQTQGVYSDYVIEGKFHSLGIFSSFKTIYQIDDEVDPIAFYNHVETSIPDIKIDIENERLNEIKTGKEVIRTSEYLTAKIPDSIDPKGRFREIK